MRTFRILVLALFVMSLLAAVGCGEGEKTTNATTETKTETPATSESAKTTETTTPTKTVTPPKDCFGQDFNFVPRYPNSARSFFGMKSGDLAVSASYKSGHIEYLTNDSVQNVAKHFSSNGAIVLSSSNVRVAMSLGDNVSIDIETLTGDNSLSGQPQTTIVIKDEKEWANLASDDPTMHIENYSTEPISSAVSYIGTKTDVVGEDPPNLRPSNKYTVRVSYSGTLAGGISCTYQTAGPFGPTVIEYLNKGYNIVAAQKYDALFADSSQGHVQMVHLKSGKNKISIRQNTRESNNAITIWITYDN